tara:strand:+ start:3185 stop:3571 length:387 start_codon:yes stop_codon:yes gene_type:complete
MTDSKNNTLNGKFIQVFIPDNKAQIYKGRNHHTKKNDWKKILFYKNRISKTTNSIINELVSCHQYKKDTFYKIGSMSNKDSIWNYYRVLKDLPAKEIAVPLKQKSQRLIPNFKVTRCPPGEKIIHKFD